MADAIRSAMQKIAQADAYTEHIDPFLFSFIDKSTEVPFTKRKRKSKKRRAKDGADNTLDNGNNYFERTAKMEKQKTSTTVARHCSNTK